MSKLFFNQYFTFCAKNSSALMGNSIKQSFLNQPCILGFLNGIDPRFYRYSTFQDIKTRTNFTELNFSSCYYSEEMWLLGPYGIIDESCLKLIGSAVYRSGNKGRYAVVACNGFEGIPRNRALCFYKEKKFSIFSDGGDIGASPKFLAGNGNSSLDYWLMKQPEFYRNLRKQRAETQL